MSVSTEHFLFNIPEARLDYIVSFCTPSEVLNLEKTRRDAHLKIKNIWLTLIIRRNLFFGFTQHPRTNIIKPYSFEKTKTVSPEEDFIPCPMHYTTCPSKARDKLLLRTRIILTTLLPHCKASQTCQSNQFLENRAQNTPWKRIYLQVALLDCEALLYGTNTLLKKLSPRNITSLEEFSAVSFLMLDRANTKKYTELFTLLENYRFSLATDTTNRSHDIKPYIFHFNLLVFKGIFHERPPIVKCLLTVLSTKHPKISFTDRAQLSNDNYPSVSQEEEEDEKLGEEQQLLAKIINTKFDQTIFPKEFFILIPPIFNNLTPLKYAITLTQQKNLDPRENPNFEILKMLIEAKANVDEPGILSFVATKIHNLDILNLLIENNANVNQSHEDDTLLGLLLKEKRHCTMLEKIDRIVFTLLKAKADINGRNGKQQTPLMLAAATSTYETFQNFLEQGPDRTLQDIEGNTPLIYATRVPGNTLKIKLLLSSRVLSSTRQGEGHLVRMPRAVINQFNIQCFTALASAIFHNHSATKAYVKLLIDAGADPYLLPADIFVPSDIMPFLYPQEHDTAPQKRHKT
jgi:hypothetical protein